MMVVTPVPMQMTMVFMLDVGSGVGALDLGASLRDRASLPSPLRGLDPSGGYPSRLRALRSLRTSFAKSRHRRAAVPDTVPGIDRSVFAPALRAALAASRSASASRAGALPASPVRASPVTGLRTAPRTCVRTAAGTTADAFGSALRATAFSTVRSARRSSAAAAPPRVPRRCRFPPRSYSRFAVPDRPGRLFVHTRRQCPRLAGQPVDFAQFSAFLACRNYLPPIGAPKRPFAACPWRPCRGLAASSTYRVPAVVRHPLWTFLRSTYKCSPWRRHTATMTGRSAGTPAYIGG